MMPGELTRRAGQTAFAAVFAATILALSACEDDDIGEQNISNQPTNAFIRAIHLSPDAPAMDVFINGWKMATELNHGQSNNYLEINEGVHFIDFSTAGAPADAAVKSLSEIQLEAGKYYTAYIYGDVSDLQAGLIVDDDRAHYEGTFRIRPIHTALDLGTLDIWNFTEGQKVERLYKNIHFGAAGKYIDLPSGSYTLGIDTNDDGRPEAVFQTPEIDAGAVLNLFTLSEAPAVSLIAQEFRGTPTRINVGVSQVRFMNISPDAPAIDAWLHNHLKPIAEDLAFGSGSGYRPVLSGWQSFHVTSAGNSHEHAILHSHNLFLHPGRSYTVTIFDDFANLTGVLLEDDKRPLRENMIRVRAIHTARGVGTVDVWSMTRTTMPDKLYDDFEFASVGDYHDLEVGTYTLGFDINGDWASDVLFEMPVLEAGSIANVYAVKHDENIYLIAQLSNGEIATMTGK